MIASSWWSQASQAVQGKRMVAAIRLPRPPREGAAAHGPLVNP
jgi:hypothetical protein